MQQGIIDIKLYVTLKSMLRILKDEGIYIYIYQRIESDKTTSMEKASTVVLGKKNWDMKIGPTQNKISLFHSIMQLLIHKED